MHLELAPVGIGQLAERVLVAGARAGQGLLGHDRILALPLLITSHDDGAARNSSLNSRRGRRLNDAARIRPMKGEPTMGKIVVSENVSLDGVVEDPTGEEGFRHGGWFTEFGAKDYQAWAEVGLAEALGADALLMGRRSDAYFGTRWMSRTGEWADRLNSLPKYVVSSTLEEPRVGQRDGRDAATWSARSRS